MRVPLTVPLPQIKFFTAQRPKVAPFCPLALLTRFFMFHFPWIYSNITHRNKRQECYNHQPLSSVYSKRKSKRFTLSFPGTQKSMLPLFDLLFTLSFWIFFVFHLRYFFHQFLQNPSRNNGLQANRREGNYCNLANQI